MSKNKEFFDQMTVRVFEHCHSMDDYISAYETLINYKRTHTCEPWESETFRDSGAGEMLLMMTQDYRRNSANR